jgi:hypothetical protein
MEEKQSEKEMLRAFIDRRLTRLRREIDDRQAQYKASVSHGIEADEESGRLYREASVLRLEYTQLCCDRESLGPVWVSLEEPRSFPPRESDSDTPTKRQPMGFRNNATE